MKVKRFIFLILIFPLIVTFQFGNFIKSSDLSINVLYAPNPVIAGEELRFGVNIRNGGPDKAENVILNSDLSDKLRDAKFSTDGENTWYTLYQNLNIGEIPQDGVKFIMIRCTVKDFVRGEILSTFRVMCDSDENESNNEMGVKINVIPTSDLLVKISSSNRFPKRKEPFNVKVFVKNNSKGISEGVYVNLRVPPELFKILKSYSNSGSFNPDDGKWWIGELKGGEIKELKLTLFLRRSVPAKISAFLNSKTRDMDLSNNSDVIPFYKEKKENLTISVLPDRDKISTCGKLYYHVVVRNKGEIPSDEKTTVSFKFPEDFEILSFTASQGFFSSDGKWIVGKISPGKFAKLDIYGKYHNSKEYFLKGKINKLDDNLVDSSFTSVVNKSEKISENGVFETLSGKNFFVGVKNFFLISAFNRGCDPSKDAYVNITLPEHFKLVNYFLSRGDFNPCKLKWHIKNLEPFKEENLLLVVIPEKTGNFTNSVNIESSETDPDMEDNFFWKEFSVVKYKSQKFNRK